jgi:broad specificity phosphatase PhoE
LYAVPLHAARYNRSVRIYLVRHGQTEWNDEGRLQGHVDTSLSEVGLEQARRVGNAFRGIEIDRILCSDLTRARQTAAEIVAATGAPISYHAELRERNFGRWEGLHFRELADRSYALATELGISFLDVRPPGGESITDLWSRTAPVVAGLQAADDRVLLVLHGGSGATMLAQALRANIETVRSFRLGNTSITELERRPIEGLYVILRYDDTSHLDPKRT